jgi:hypothetical protein
MRTTIFRRSRDGAPRRGVYCGKRIGRLVARRRRRRRERVGRGGANHDMINDDQFKHDSDGPPTPQCPGDTTNWLGGVISAPPLEHTHLHRGGGGENGSKNMTWI